MHWRPWMGLLLAGAFLTAPRGAQAQARRFRLPLATYPIDDGCLPWGGFNPKFPRCGRAGRHVADDACAGNGTPVLAVADGRVRLATSVGDCFDNWGWVVVVEHALPDGASVCSIYGHCAPDLGVEAGKQVELGQQIATIENLCLPHIHFGIYAGPYGAADGVYPDWLLGYLPDGTACAEYPVAWPGNYMDPVAFVLARTALERETWAQIKTLFR